MPADLDRIVVEPKVAFGKPIVRGTRLSVEFILELLAGGWSEAEILANYPHLSREDILACLAYARDAVGSERVFPVNA